VAARCTLPDGRWRTPASGPTTARIGRLPDACRPTPTAAARSPATLADHIGGAGPRAAATRVPPDIAVPQRLSGTYYVHGAHRRRVRFIHDDNNTRASGPVAITLPCRVAGAVVVPAHSRARERLRGRFDRPELDGEKHPVTHRRRRWTDVVLPCRKSGDRHGGPPTFAGAAQLTAGRDLDANKIHPHERFRLPARMRALAGDRWTTNAGSGARCYEHRRPQPTTTPPATTPRFRGLSLRSPAPSLQVSDITAPSRRLPRAHRRRRVHRHQRAAASAAAGAL